MHVKMRFVAFCAFEKESKLNLTTYSTPCVVENFMKHFFILKNAKKFGVLFVLFLILSIFIFSCKEADDDSCEIYGLWKDAYSSYYEISRTSLKTYGDTWTSYEGCELQVRETSSSSGYIYIKYTVAMNDDYSYSSSAPDVGKYYALYYKDLSSSAVQISGAGKTGGKTSMATLKEAVEEFTVENGYFAMFSECVRVRD